MTTKETLVKTLHTNLNLAKSERLLAKNDPKLAVAKAILKQYQVDRLKTTHQDFLNSPDTKKATHFFLKELYGTKDLGQRDKDLEKLIPMMEKLFPLNALEVITNAIVLDALTEVLDNKMAKALGPDFTNEQYLKEYKNSTSKEDRLKQIELTQSLGYSLCELVHIPFLNTTLKMMRMPARLANLQDMHQFLEEGFNIFKETKNAKGFVQQLTEREKSILDEIYSDNPVTKINNNI